MQIEKVIKDAASEMDIYPTFKTVSIASAAMGGFGGFGDKLREEIITLIKSKGMGILPLVIINGTLRYSTNVPSFEEANKLLSETN
jgi:hypothetical protein